MKSARNLTRAEWARSNWQKIHNSDEPKEEIMRTLIGMSWLFFVFGLMAVASVEAQTPPTAITAIRAGRLIDPETGTAATDQVIIIEGEKIKAI